MALFYKKYKKRGLSLLELMISVLILGLIFLFILPVFITSSKGVLQEKMVLRASSFSQGLAERIKQVSSTVYDSTTNPPTYFYNVLHQIYDPSTPYANSAVFNGTSFLANRSYIVVNNEDTGGNIRSKRLTIHLEWETTIGAGAASSRPFDFVTYLSQPAASWALSPGLPPTTSSTSTIATSSTSTSSISTSSIPTTSTIGTTSIRTTSIRTTSTIRPSTTSTIRPSTTSTIRPSTTSTSSTSTTTIPRF